MSYIAQINDGTNTYPIASSLYGTCNTEADIIEKQVILSDFTQYAVGVTIYIKFEHGNTATNPTLNINNTGAKSIIAYGDNHPSILSDGTWNDNSILSFTYDGTSWFIDNYYDLPKAEYNMLGGILSGGSLNVLPDGTPKLRFYDQAITGDVDVADMGIIDEFGHNKLSYLNPDYIIVEYSTDGGSTWQNYSVSNSMKTRFVTYGNVNFVVGGGSSYITTGCQVRATLVLEQGSTGTNTLFTVAEKLLFNMGTGGAKNCQLNVSTQTFAQRKAQSTEWVDCGTYRLSDAGGWSSIPFSYVVGGNNTAHDNNIGSIRLTLSFNTYIGGASNRVSMYGLRLIGHESIISPSELSTSGRLYTINESKDAEFPAKVTATEFVGNATSASKLGTTTVGSVTKPIYLENGVPKEANSYPSDTKNTAGSTDTSDKIFLVGAKTQGANPQTYSDNQVYATNGQLDANKIRIAEAVTLEYNSTQKCIEFVFD